jgi:type IV pilus assembly protein PilE
MKKNNNSGFTLVELMVVIAILAVLVTVTLPTYQNSVRKAARTAAKGVLFDVVSRQEQYFMNNKSYSATLADLGLPASYAVNKSSKIVGTTSTDRAYTITLANTSATAFDAVATAQLGQASDGCGNYTLKSDGTQAVSGAVGADGCW